MPAKKGSLGLIKRGNADGPPETFTTLGGIQSNSFTVGGQPIEVTTADDVDANNATWRTFIAGINEGTVNAQGITKDFQPIQSLVADAIVGTVTGNYQIVIPNVGMFEAPFVISNVQFENPYDNVATFSFDMNMTAAPTVTYET